MSPCDDQALLDLLRGLRDAAADETAWPQEAWGLLVERRVTAWGIAAEFGGAAFPTPDLLASAIDLARGDLATAFIWSQFQAAAQRLAEAPAVLAARWLPGIARGECFATVGLSHLTTSRSRGPGPAVMATRTDSGYRITGEIPWVSGGCRAAVIVVGATLVDGREWLLALPRDRNGVTVLPALPLLALQGSLTGPVRLDDVVVSTTEIIAGPVAQVMKQSRSGGAGSLTTSALAIGHAFGIIDRWEHEPAGTSESETARAAVLRSAMAARDDLLAAAQGEAGPQLTAETLRWRATSLALDASQAYLTAAKGAGFVRGHPAERLARESLFFLVWSCPQSVAGQLLRSFSGCDA